MKGLVLVHLVLSLALVLPHHSMLTPAILTYGVLLRVRVPVPVLLRLRWEHLHLLHLPHLLPHLYRRLRRWLWYLQMLEQAL